MPAKPSYADLLNRIRELETDREARKDHAVSRDDGLLGTGGQYFRDLVENSPTGISIIQDDIVVYRNPEQQRIFGPLKEGGRPSIFEKIHPDDEVKLRDLIQSTLSGHAVNAGMELRFIHLLGETVGEQAMKWLYCRLSLIELQGKAAVLINMMDMTKSREAARLITMQDRMSSLGHVAAGIAHEIRNPLSVINIFLDSAGQMIEGGFDKEDMKEIFGKIHAATSRIESVIRRVMDFSKPSEPDLMRIDINKPIEDALGLSSVMLRKTGIEIKKDLAQGLPPCLADYQLIEQVVLNLITNAAEAMQTMQAGKRIIVSSLPKGSRTIQVSVADSGPGVPSDMARRIFDPFFTTKGSSTGIGLTLCQRIVHDHGGVLRVSPSAMGGAEFSFTIPANT